MSCPHVSPFDLDKSLLIGEFQTDKLIFFQDALDFKCYIEYNMDPFLITQV